MNEQNISSSEIENVYLDELTDEQLNNMTADEFEQVLQSIPTPSNNELRRYMKTLSRHTPGKEAIKAKRKVTNRAKNKLARKQRKANRK